MTIFVLDIILAKLRERFYTTGNNSLTWKSFLSTDRSAEETGKFLR